MTAGELIEELKKYDPDLYVVINANNYGSYRDPLKGGYDEVENLGEITLKFIEKANREQNQNGEYSIAFSRSIDTFKGLLLTQKHPND